MFTTASTVRHRIFSPYGALAAGSAGVALCAGAGVAGGAMVRPRARRAPAVGLAARAGGGTPVRRGVRPRVGSWVAAACSSARGWQEADLGFG
eukprot:366009-Chlamydomonas_euryale.AAC.34